MAYDLCIVCVQKELSTELALRTRAERSKQEEVRGKRAAQHRSAARKPAKKEKLLCVCRTPYDNSKWDANRHKLVVASRGKQFACRRPNSLCLYDIRQEKDLGDGWSIPGVRS